MSVLMRFGALALAASTMASVPAAAVTLVTPLSGGNAQSGVMFDIVAGSQALTITGGAVSLANGSYTIEVYTRPGTVVGNLGPAGWTLISTLTGVTGGGVGTQSAIDFADFSLAAGATMGLYITSILPGQGIVNYTNGTAVGAVLASDANLSILQGYGRSYAFGSQFAPRNFNGSITYDVATSAAIPEPASWALLIAGFGLTGAAARRRRTAISA